MEWRGVDIIAAIGLEDVWLEEIDAGRRFGCVNKCVYLRRYWRFVYRKHSQKKNLRVA